MKRKLLRHSRDRAKDHSQAEASKGGVREICRKLKLQLDELGVAIEAEIVDLPAQEKSRRTVLMEQLKEQLAELSR
jgi:hypothetical protein